MADLNEFFEIFDRNGLKASNLLSSGENMNTKLIRLRMKLALELDAKYEKKVVVEEAK